MHDLINRLSPAAAEVKEKASRTAEIRDRAIRVRQQAEQELGLSFRTVDGHLAGRGHR